MTTRRALASAAPLAAVLLACPTPIDPAPDDPAAPDGPAIGADPAGPTGPTDPTNPTNPTDPDAPSDPVDDPPQDPDEPAPCTYPSAGALEAVGDVMPRLVWSDARRADGSTFSFDLLDAHCDDELVGIVFILSAAWCPSCPGYVADVASAAAQIEAAGGLLVFLELQDASYQPASNADAHQVIGGWAGDVGIRVGDGGSDQPGLVNASPIWSAVPGGLLVRTSDMQVVENQDDSPFLIDWLDALAGLGGPAPGDGPGDDPSDGPEDGACTEEPSEPNDGAADAAHIGPGTFQGGVCGDDADYFHIALAGAWTLDLVFSHAEGDLDVVVVDEWGLPVFDDGARVGSDSADDDESVSWHDPAIVKVYGYQGATNTYALTLSGGLL